MKTLAATVMCACMVLAASAGAQDPAKKTDAMTKDSTAPKSMTMQECKDHMAMTKDMAKKDDATMKKDTMCADMMKKEGAMKKDATSGEPAKK
jgi:hypothetical protein